MIPSQSSSEPRGEARTPNAEQGSLLSPGADHEPVGRYAQDELSRLRAAREAFEAEKHVAEQALEQRRQELERQSKLLVARLQEMHDREQRLANELEDALPERHNEYPRRSRRADVNEDSHVETTLRRQLRDQQISVELLSAERDAAWSQLQQFREQQRELETFRAERDARASHHAEDDTLPIQTGEMQDLHGQIEALKQQQEVLRQERDTAWGYLQELPERVNELATVKAERDAALEQLRALTESVQADNNNDESWLDLDSPQGELALLKIQVTEQRDVIDRLRGEINESRNRTRQIPVSEHHLIEQLRSERDAVLARLQQLSAAPESWTQEEAEFTTLRLQIKQEQRRLTEDFQELHRREADITRRHEQVTQEIQREQLRLEHLAQELETLAQQLRQDRAPVEAKERELRLRDAQIHLREAEIREMIEIAELDAARDRSELNQERLKLARFREAIRLERNALRADQIKNGRPPTLPGLDL